MSPGSRKVDGVHSHNNGVQLRGTGSCLNQHLCGGGCYK
jgi:hypothetical protein